MLAPLLTRYADRPLRIGSLSAASNVTGILTDTEAITRLLHEHGLSPSRTTLPRHP